MLKLKKLLSIIFLLVIFGHLIKANNYSCEVINYNTKCSIIDGKLVIEKYTVLQINSRNGDIYAKITIPYNKSNKLTNLQARIEDKYGNVVRKLKKKDIIQINAATSSLYQDDFIKKFTLKHNTYPYRIYYSYKIIHNKFLEIANWSPAYNLKLPTRNAKLELMLPDAYKIKTLIHGNYNEQKINHQGHTYYCWTSSYEHPIETEILAPKITELIPKIIILPLYFRYGIKGDYNSWESLGNWFYNLNRNLDQLPEEDIFKVKELIKNTNNKTQQVKTLYNYLKKNTRYINVKIDIGGFKPYPAEYVSKNKYGDCKALTNYMKSLLNIAGIKSYYSIINAGENITEIDTNFPSIQFNHVILMVPINSDTIWLECTDNTNPFGYLGTFTQNRNALIIEKDNSRLVKTPKLLKNDVSSARNITVEIANNLTCKSTIKQIFKGSDFESFKYLYTSFNKMEQEQIIKEHLFHSDYEINNFSFDKAHIDSAEMIFNANIKIHNLFKKYEKDIIINPFSMSLPKLEIPNNRKLPLKMNYPIYLNDTITYHFLYFPTIIKTPKNYHVDSTFGKYSVKYIKRNNSIILTKEIFIKAGVYPVHTYHKFYNFISSIKEYEESKIIFKIQ